MTADSLVAVARRFSFVREIGGPNRGLWVEFFLSMTGNEPGESWCCSFVSVVLLIASRWKSPLHSTASCANMLAEAKRRGMVVPEPQVGCLCFSVTTTGHAHHVGIVTSISPLTTIAGNTSVDGTSSNGDGVYEHTISLTDKVFVSVTPPER